MSENNNINNSGYKRRRRSDRYRNNGVSECDMLITSQERKRVYYHFSSIVDLGFPIAFINKYITDACKGYTRLNDTIMNPDEARREYLKIAKSTALIRRIMAGEMYCTPEEIKAVYFLCNCNEYDRIIFDRNYHSWYEKPFNVKVCYEQCNPWIVNAILECCTGVEFNGMNKVSVRNYYNYQAYDQDGVLFSYTFER